jgi:hypothetical protein
MRRGISYFPSTTPSAFGVHPSKGGELGRPSGGGEFWTPSPPAPLPRLREKGGSGEMFDGGCGQDARVPKGGWRQEEEVGAL